MHARSRATGSPARMFGGSATLTRNRIPNREDARRAGRTRCESSPGGGVALKKLIHRPQAVVEERAEGLAAAYPGLRRLPGHTVRVWADLPTPIQRPVAAVFGGGSASATATAVRTMGVACHLAPYRWPPRLHTGRGRNRAGPGHPWRAGRAAGTAAAGRSGPTGRWWEPVRVRPRPRSFVPDEPIAAAPRPDAGPAVSKSARGCAFRCYAANAPARHGNKGLDLSLTAIRHGGRAGWRACQTPDDRCRRPARRSAPRSSPVTVLPGR